MMFLFYFKYYRMLKSIFNAFLYCLNSTVQKIIGRTRCQNSSDEKENLIP